MSTGSSPGAYDSGVIEPIGGASPQQGRIPQAGWQSALGRSPEVACPLLGLRQDPGSRFSMPVDERRCMAGHRPATIDADHQRTFCLAAAFATCERLTARPDAAELIAAVLPTGSPGPGTASTGALASTSMAAPASGPAEAPDSSTGSDTPAPSSAAGGPRRPRGLVLVVGIVLIGLVVVVILAVASLFLAPVAAGATVPAIASLS